MKNLSVIPIDKVLRKLITLPPLITWDILHRYGYNEINQHGEKVVHYVLMEHFLTNDCTSAIVNNIYKDCEKPI